MTITVTSQLVQPQPFDHARPCSAVPASTSSPTELLGRTRPFYPRPLSPAEALVEAMVGPGPCPTCPPPVRLLTVTDLPDDLDVDVKVDVDVDVELGTAVPAADSEGQSALERLRTALADLGVAPHARDWITTTAETLGALESGQALADLPVPGHSNGTDTGRADTKGASADPADGSDDGSGETGVGEPDRGALRAAGSRVLDRIGVLSTLTAHLESATVQAAGQLAVGTGRVLLRDKGVTSPGELSATARRRWESSARNTAAAEITAFTGLGPGQARDMVNLATTPASVSGTVTSSMGNGIAPWALARAYYRAATTAGLAHEDATHVATVLFGTDPATVAEERLDRQGRIKDEPWNHQEFRKALDREIAAVRSRDPQSAREAREQARKRRDIHVKANSDGTGQVIINATATQAVAVNDRIERAARKARAGGDERTLGQLRSDLAMSLMLHSRLNLPDLPADPDLVTTEHTDQLAQVLLALPSAVLQVVVPYAAFLHDPNQPLPPFVAAPARPPDPNEQDTPPAAQHHQPDHAQHPEPDHEPDHAQGHEPDHAQDREPSQAQDAEPGQDTSSDSTEESCPGCRREAQLRLTRETITQILNDGADVYDVREAAAAGLFNPPPQTLPVGEALGALPYFLTADEIRDLALQPGTELSRLLVEPADGRCIERTINSYAPDGLMRAQIHAADLTCRAPGCVQHAGYTQLDHVLEWPQGPTSETNLQSAHQGHHHLLTCKAWKAVMDPTDRSVTWHTLLGRIYRTRVHDYRQYTRLLTDAIDRVQTATQAVLDDPTATDLTRKHARNDAIDQAIIHALAWRDPGQPLTPTPDNHDPAGPGGYQAWTTTILTHTTPDGQRRTGPLPHIQQAERQRQARAKKAATEAAKDDAAKEDPEQAPGDE